MVAAYSVQGDNTIGASAITTLELIADASAPRRFEVFEFQYGFVGTLENSMQHLRVGRMTASGTGTSVTPRPLDPADAAATADAERDHTVEPTYTAGEDLFDMPLNSQAKDRWVAVPGFGLIAPATAANGFGFEARRGTGSTFAGDMEVLVFFQE